MKPGTVFNETAFQNFLGRMRRMYAKAYTKNLLPSTACHLKQLANKAKNIFQ